ncbi:unnamed protein product [Calicophoron daubneyi]|uniref:Cytoplasmic tRNA 2-thiolation protein 2 n=1 Tax=Calicophoron daubneyi TaxID=300641 RepID=A0AAV2TPD2_CALDB
MCSNQDSCLPLTQTNVNPRRSACVKCHGTPALIIRSDDPAWCRSCFLDGCLHKFKSAFGKTNVVPNGVTVAVAYSGGLCSSATLCILKQVHKLNFKPVLFHLVEPNNPREYEDEIASRMRDSGLDYHFFVDHGTNQFTQARKSCDISKRLINLTCLDEIESWSRQLKLVQCARALGCSYLLLSQCGTGLSVNFVTGVVGGRGNYAACETAFADHRYGDVVILRPLYEMMVKELVFFSRYMGLHPLTPQGDITNTVLEHPDVSALSRVCDNFVASLQNGGFPSTTRTILSTSSKLVRTAEDSVKETSIRCRLCKAPVLPQADTSDPNALAIASLAYSRSLSTRVNPTHQCSYTEGGQCSLGSCSGLCTACMILWEELPVQLRPSFTALLDTFDIPPTRRLSN